MDPHATALVAELAEVRADVLAAEDAHAAVIAATHPRHRRSAANLVHYVELRKHDLRELQAKLAERGLSSLGRCEANVLATIEAVLGLLSNLSGRDPSPAMASISLGEGDLLLAHNADLLLGPNPAHRSTRIMVTLPSGAADNSSLVTKLVANGMDIARINCAHDSAELWTAMVDHLRSCDRPRVTKVRTAMDLAGPKLRTGPMQLGPAALRVAPVRDQLGHVIRPALVWLSATNEPVPEVPSGRSIAVVPVADAAFLEGRRPDDRLEITDSRGSVRTWKVVEPGAGGCLVSTEQTTYLTTGIVIGHRDEATGKTTTTSIGELPRREQLHRVQRGDRVILTRSLEATVGTPEGAVHRIGCTLPDAFTAVRPKERVWLDDGKMGGPLDTVTPDEITVTITDIRPGGANLKSGKGINFPDSDLRLDTLTAKDRDDLPFVVGHADMVNFSFVRRPDDVVELQDELKRLDAADMGIVLKIENVMASRTSPSCCSLRCAATVSA